jgi:hypothetical protein
MEQTAYADMEERLERNELSTDAKISQMQGEKRFLE